MILNFIFKMLSSGGHHRASEEINMIVCHCTAVTDRAIRKAVRSGARTRNQVVEACAVNMCCGGCAPAIDEIIEAETDRENARSFTSFSKLAVVS